MSFIKFYTRYAAIKKKAIILTNFLFLEMIFFISMLFILICNDFIIAILML